MNRPKTLSVFMLTMINVATIGSVKNWPLTAEFGFSSVFFFLLATLIFFLPTSLVAAELATTMPKLGGVFVWVKEAFGQRWGFLASWLLWVQNIFWYPTALSYIASTVSYAFNPALAQNRVYTYFVVLGTFWVITLINLRGMRTSGWISTLGMILGTFLPGIFIITLGASWFMSGHPSQIAFNTKTFFPDMSSINQLVLFTGVLISLAGIEMSAVHARDVENPKKDYPKAIFYCVAIILGLSIPGVLSIAAVVPQQEINLLSGSIQALSSFLSAYNLRAILPLLAILIAFGTTASVSTWVVGPTKGLLAAAEAGDLPPFLRRVNKKGMPTPLLLGQAMIVTTISSIFVLVPNLNEAYWMLMAMCSELYLLMYLLMFAAAVYLRYKHPKMERPYKVPGKNWGIWVVSSIGILGSLFAMVIGLLPPQHLTITNTTNYVWFMIAGVVLFSFGPSIILLFQKPSWKK